MLIPLLLSNYLSGRVSEFFPAFRQDQYDPSAKHTHARTDKEFRKEKLKMLQTSERLQ